LRECILPWKEEMRMMKRIILILAAALCLLGGQARAEDAPAELPPELRQAVPEAAELVTGDAGESFGLLSGIRSLLEEALAGGRTLLTSGIRSAAAIMAGVILLGVVESAAPAGGELLERYGTAVGALWVTAMAAGDLNALIGLGRETITEISLLGKALLPALAAAEAASGGITAASVRQVAAVFFSGVLLTVIERILLPAVYLYIGVAAAAAVVEGEALERVGELLKKAVGWVLGGLLTVFVTYLTISGAVAGAADAHAVKLAKSAVSAAVPVVGGILSDAAESVLAGAGLLRGMVGTLGTLALLGACLTPFLHLGCQYLFYQAASLVSAAAGPKKLTRLIAMLGDAFGLVLAMTAASALLLLVSLMTSVLSVTP